MIGFAATRCQSRNHEPRNEVLMSPRGSAFVGADAPQPIRRAWPRRSCMRTNSARRSYTTRRRAAVARVAVHADAPGHEDGGNGVTAVIKQLPQRAARFLQCAWRSFLEATRPRLGIWMQAARCVWENASRKCKSWRHVCDRSRCCKTSPGGTYGATRLLPIDRVERLVDEKPNGAS